MQLAAIFTDHMVLQRRKPIAVFGDGTGHGRIKLGHEIVEFDGYDGFLVHLPPMEAGGPYDMTVTLNGETTVLTDILVGDVYLAGGQSNMQFRVEESTDIPRIPNGRVRHFREGHCITDQGEEWTENNVWQVATEEYLGGFSAIGYDAGRMLCEELDVPVGIISCNLGATRVDAWTSPEIVETPAYQKMIEQRHWDWTYYAFNHDSWPYRTKLLPIVPYGIAGVLWYQGESNRHPAEAVYYHAMLSQLIQNWRKLWREELPFYIVQIAPFADTPDNDWAHIRQGQELAARAIPETYLCTLVHTGEADNIHPTKKHTLATEVANAVLCAAFGYDREYSGPVIETVEKTADGLRLTFTHAAGMHFDGDPTDLTVYDAEGNPLPYTAAIAGDTLTLTAPGAMRADMGFCNAPTHNLYNDSGYLASPFQIIM